MKILLIHQIYMSEKEAGGTRHQELARHLRKLGHQVVVIASRISYLTGERVSETSSDVIRVWSTAGVQRSFPARLFSFLTFMFSSVIAALFVRRVSIVWGTSPPIFQGLSAWLVARIKRVPFIFEVRDLWPDFAIQTGVVKNRLLIYFARRLEHFLYSHADHLIVNSPGFIPYLVHCGVPQEKISLIPNGVEVADFAAPMRVSALRREFGFDGCFIALYAGALGLANDIDTIIAAARKLSGVSAIRFVLLGDGKERPRLQAQVQSLNLKNLVFIPAQPKSRMPEFLAAADVCLATLRPSPQRPSTDTQAPDTRMCATTYPNKVFDYMAAGRPTVLAITGVIRDCLITAGGGIAVPPGDAQALAEAVLKYYQNPELCRQHGEAARSYVARYFNRQEHACQLAQLLAIQQQAGLLKRRIQTKRLGDLLVAIPLVVLLLPVMLLIAAVVWIKLGSPVIFSQLRAGHHGKLFTLWKFRTMTDECDATGRPLPDEQRLTGVGRFLRSTSLDELPTLFNVIKGDMSLIGPRPLLPEYLSRYTPTQARRHEVKPGITGWAQVNGRNALTWEEKLALDVEYVERLSLALDLRILLMTVLTVLKRSGISAPGHATAPVFDGKQ